MKKFEPKFVNRDISWLSFNSRVLQEATDKRVPLLERLKFLGIFSNNQDEFFRVRVAFYKRLQRLDKSTLRSQKINFDINAVLDKINAIVKDQGEIFEDIYSQILRDLELNSIFIVNEEQLSKNQKLFAQEYFFENILPSLVPVMINKSNQFPYIKDRTAYLLVELFTENKPGKYSIIEIPASTLPRFISLTEKGNIIILLDDIIRLHLDQIFYNFKYDKINAYTFKITRDAELDIDSDVNKSLIGKISESLKSRKKGLPTRLVYDEGMPEGVLNLLLKNFKLMKDSNVLSGGRYHNFRDFIKFPNIDKEKLKSPKMPSLNHQLIPPRSSIFNIVKKQDLLIAYPYQTFHHVIDFLREAAIDPKVKSISITLYRVANNSHVVNALINAIKNGKKVLCIVELQARFDEENNITQANRLIDEGAQVIYGVPGLKTHSKLFLITRAEGKDNLHYAHIGTGNFNEDTSKLYTDYTLLTCDKRIADEVAAVFEFYKDNTKIYNHKHLWLAPFSLRKNLKQAIEQEIKNANAKKTAWIFLKLNSLVDEDIITLLYNASNAGVKIRLIIRGICSLIPGVKGMSENIEVISIIDRFLEHARVFVFCNGDKPNYFISSADIMTRNLDYRSEVAAPIFDKNIQQILLHNLELQWSDNTKARVIDQLQSNNYKTSVAGGKHISAQQSLYEFYKRNKAKTF